MDYRCNLFTSQVGMGNQKGIEMIVVFFPHEDMHMHIFDLAWWDSLEENGFENQIVYTSAFCVWNSMGLTKGLVLDAK